MEPNKFSSEHIENEVLNLISETSYNEYCLKIKLRTNFDKYDKIFEQPEEELMYFMEQQHQESKHIGK